MMPSVLKLVCVVYSSFYFNLSHILTLECDKSLWVYVLSIV